MEYQKITLEDLVKLEDGTGIEVEAPDVDRNPVYNLICDEVAHFIEKPKREDENERQLRPKEHFFVSVPETSLKRAMDRLLRNKSGGEERSRKCLQFEFDRKMQRINKIKSKSYRKMRRKDKIRKEEELRALLSDSDESDIEDSKGTEDNGVGGRESESVLGTNDDGRAERQLTENALMITDLRKASTRVTTAASLTAQQKEVMSIFEKDGEDAEEDDPEFRAEKAEIAERDAPKIVETVLPGWGDWAGEGIVTTKNNSSTVVKVKEGVMKDDRKDFGKDHVIVNENVVYPVKYTSELPYGYSYKDYREKLKVPISFETTSSRIFKKFVKISAKPRPVPGKAIEPAEYEPEY